MNIISINGEYTTFKDGKHITVHALDDCIESIKERNEDNERTIERLIEEIKELKSEHYKDKEVSRIDCLYKQMKNDYRRGFPILKEEEEAINKWIAQHRKSCSGRVFRYVFCPTGFGTSGEVVCSCGEKIQFRSV